MISPDDPKLGSISQEQVDECHCIELRLIARATNLCEWERERERERERVLAFLIIDSVQSVTSFKILRWMIYLQYFYNKS